jgi:hypothetical protein
MNRLFFLFTSCFLFLFLTTTTSAATSCDDLKKLGYLSVTCAPYNADPTCAKDSTAGIQSAINDAYNKNMVAFFPSGTYCVSNTLEGVKPGIRQKGHELVGSTAGSTPVIKLKANSPGFGNESNLKPVIWLHTICVENDPAEKCKDSSGKVMVGEERPAMGFMETIRNLNVEVDSGNPGAVGIAMWGAQDNSLLHVNVNLTKSGYAGFSGMVGDNSAISDIQVDGGKFGITTAYGGSNNVRWPVMTNLRLYNQSVAAIGGSSATNWMFAGLHIKKNSAPAIVPEQTNTATQNFSIIDGMIEFNTINNEPAIKNAKDKAVTLVNVHIKNANTIIQNPNNSLATKTPSGWNRVTTYGHPGKSGQNMVNGNINTQTYAEEVIVANPASNLLSRHSVDKSKYPTGDVILTKSRQGDKKFAFAPDHGITPSSSSGTDVSTKLQNLIDSGVETIYLPGGDYPITRTLLVKESTHLTGQSNQDTSLVMADSWKPTKSNPATLIRTPNSASAAPRFSFFSVIWKDSVADGHYKPAIHIQSGKTEYVDFRTITAWAPDGEDYPNNNTLMTGNAGGRFYGMTLFNNGHRKGHADYRHLIIDGTRNPIIMYGPNPEDQQGSAIGTEIKNAQNVAILGAKTEDNNTLLVSNSSNILGYSMASFTNARFVNVNNVSGSFHPKYINTKPQLVESFNGTTRTINSTYQIGIFLRGKVEYTKIFSTSSEPIPSSIPTNIPNSPIPSAIPSSQPLTWDLNNSGKVDIFDFSYLVKGFGSLYSLADIVSFRQAL